MASPSAGDIRRQGSLQITSALGGSRRGRSADDGPTTACFALAMFGRAHEKVMSLKSRFGPILSQFKALMPGGASGANEDDFIAKLEATQAVIAQACQLPVVF